MSRRKGLYVHLDLLWSQYIDKSGTEGGDASGFAEFVQRGISDRPDLIEGHINEFIKAAAKLRWQKKPRDAGPDLFSIAGIVCPETVTRPAAGYVEGPIDEHGSGFKKVGQRHATLNDLADDAAIKSRKAAEVGAAANKRWQMVDEGRRRAKGHMGAFLKDIADKS